MTPSELAFSAATVSMLLTSAAQASPVFRVRPAGQEQVEISATGLITNSGVLAASQLTATGSTIVRWSPGGGLQTLGNPAYVRPLFTDVLNVASARAISGNGDVIVGSAYSTGAGVLMGYRWDSVNGFKLLSIGPRCNVDAVSSDGQVAAGSLSPGSTEMPVYWTEPTGEHAVGGASDSDFRDASSDGSVLVGYLAGTFESFAGRWTQSTGYVALPSPPGGQFAAALAISEDGSVVVGGAGNNGVRWVQEVPEVLPMLADATGMVAIDVNENGQVVVGGANIPGGSTGFVWTPELGTMSAAAYFSFGGVDLTGVSRIRDIVSISPDGRWFTGHADFDLGNGEFSTEVYVVAIPAPWSGGLAVVAAGSLARRRRRAEAA